MRLQSLAGHFMKTYTIQPVPAPAAHRWGFPPFPPRAFRGDHDTCSPGSARTLRPPPGFAFGRRLLGRTGSCRTGPPPSWRIVTPRRGDRGPRVCGRRGELGSRWPRHGTLWRCLRGGVVIKAMMMKRQIGEVFAKGVSFIVVTIWIILVITRVPQNLHRVHTPVVCSVHSFTSISNDEKLKCVLAESSNHVPCSA